jgi:hypothetical protein
MVEDFAQLNFGSSNIDEIYKKGVPNKKWGPKNPWGGFGFGDKNKGYETSETPVNPTVEQPAAIDLTAPEGFTTPKTTPAPKKHIPTTTGYVGPDAARYENANNIMDLYEPLAAKPSTPEFNLQTQDMKGYSPEQQKFQNKMNSRSNIATGLHNFVDSGGAAKTLGYIGQAAGAFANMFPGEAEVQRSPLVNLDRLQYRDMSGQLRKQATMNERVTASNARNVSGGNVQNYRQNRRMAGLQKLQDLERINAGEKARWDKTANQNIMIGQREDVINNQIRRGDEQVNAANRGALRNSKLTGIGQLGQLAGIAGRDTQAQINQEKMFETLASMGLYSRDKNGRIIFNG